MRREIHSNHRLVVTPDLRGVLPPGDQDAILRLIKDMAAQVRRHVDCVRVVGVEYDKRYECSHCGYEWETLTADDVDAIPADYEGHVIGEPMCCDKAADEFRAEQSQTLATPSSP